MARPNKIKEPTVTYNLNIPVKMKEQLSAIAFSQSKNLGLSISIADIIRGRIKEYLEDRKHHLEK